MKLFTHLLERHYFSVLEKQWPLVKNPWSFTLHETTRGSNVLASPQPESCLSEANGGEGERSHGHAGLGPAARPALTRPRLLSDACSQGVASAPALGRLLFGAEAEL